MKPIKKRILKIIGITTGAVLAGGTVAAVQDHVRNKKEDRKCKSLYEDCIKRGLDFCCGMAALIVFWPLYMIVAILVRVKLGKPVLYTAERAGRIDTRTGKETVFKLYKFRSMTDAVDGEGNPLPDSERLTKFGRLLRSTSLDELPEAINIVKGDMSVIGPRPLPTIYLPYYYANERHRHDVRPGLSGWAQVNGRNSVKWEKKFALDVEYVKMMSFIEDAKIVLMSFVKALKRDDIGQGQEAPESLHIERA